MLREIADDIEKKDDGQLCKLVVTAHFAHPLECEGGAEYLAELEASKKQ